MQWIKFECALQVRSEAGLGLLLDPTSEKREIDSAHLGSIGNPPYGRGEASAFLTGAPLQAINEALNMTHNCKWQFLPSRG